MVYTNIILCLSDAIAWSLEKTPGFFLLIINYIFSSLAYVAIPVLTYTWFLFAIFNIFRNESMLEKYERFLLPLVVFNTVFMTLNVFTHWIFYLDSNNSYHRGPLFYPYVMVCFSILPITFGLLVYNRKKIQPDHFLPMIMFIVPTIITSLLAIIVYGIALSWMGTTIAIFIIYLFTQSQRLGTDYLTNLYNRRQLNEYLHHRMNSRRSNEHFGIAMIDINQFKRINDTWGHKIGDEVLITLAKILKTSFRSREFISRYAGDEFIVVMEASTREEMAAAINRFINAINQYNEMFKKPWVLSVSIGYDLYDPSSGMNIDEFIHHVDSLMYKSKAIPGNAALTAVY